VSRVIDLRPARTCRREPTPFSDHRLGRNLSVQGVADPPDPSTTLTESYCFLLDRNPGLFAAVIQEIAEAPAGAVVVHCHSGKDRTGLVIALALTMVGADRSAILADYALSNDRVAATYAGGRHPGATPGPSLRDHRTARRETLLRTLEHLDRRYGCVAEYLAAGWLHPDVPATLSDRLTQPTPRAARG
jgi:protein-tyrosine phosphatase